MKYRELLIEQLASLPYFDKKVIVSLSAQYAIKPATLDVYISRSLARRDLIQLRKGLYTTTDFYNKHITDSAYLFYLANVLRIPSYVSSWSALQYYDLTTDRIESVTSVTPKITRTYTNKAGKFVYHSIQKSLFTGFILVPGTFDFYIATPAKALFDLLYFQTNQLRGIQSQMIEGMVDELRIPIEDMEKAEQKTFFTMIKNYLEKL